MNRTLQHLFGGGTRKTRRLGMDFQMVTRLWEPLQTLSDIAFDTHVADERRDVAAESDGRLRRAATACEAARRTLGLSLHENQINGLLALHDRQIVELPTGEGKTVMAACHLYGATAGGKRAHVVTANSYLARRDAAWMAPLYHRLGMRVAVIDETSDRDQVQQAATADVVYSTAGLLSLGRLRDELVTGSSRTVQLPYDIALVDEADTVLLDQAVRPASLTVADAGRSEELRLWWNVAVDLQQNDAEGEGGDFGVDERDRAVALTDAGWDRVERATGRRLYDLNESAGSADLRDALTARALLHKGRDYLVREDTILPIDRNTGRAGTGRFGGGVHTALEMKENLPVTPLVRQLNRMTLQDQFSRYTHLCGMTASAAGAEDELQDLYGLEVLPLPSHVPSIRCDLDDVIYATRNGKLDALADDIAGRHETGQPVLVGVDTLEDLADLGERLQTLQIPHRTLSAENHEQEADIIARSGHLGAVTIATRIAGRGVDIVLGADGGEAEQVRDAGGLCVLGAQRFDTRRADQQLRGRAGRQGDPGESRYYLSLEDELIHIYGGTVAARAITTLTNASGAGSGHRSLTQLVDKAQAQRTGQLQAHRKSLLTYDQLLSKQRQKLLTLRSEMVTMLDQLPPEDRPAEGQASDDPHPIVVKLRELDISWADHLDDAEVLRRAVGLRQLGRLDPQTEYRRELDGLFSLLLDRLAGSEASEPVRH